MNGYNALLDLWLWLLSGTVAHGTSLKQLSVPFHCNHFVADTIVVVRHTLTQTSGANPVGAAEVLIT
jgi:hypothetical protein